MKYLLFICLSTMLASYAIPEKLIVVIIPSYNNASVCRTNLESVFMQEYHNYKVIYIDDASDDQTGTLVPEIINEHNQAHRTAYIKNNIRRGHMFNYYTAIHTCPNDAIIVCLDGDDWLAHTHVLQRINEIYQDNTIWMTYGQYKEWPSGKLGIGKKIPEYIHTYNAYRYYDWVTSHLRTFYAGLFKAIPLGYLLYKNQFQPSAVDCAMMFSMLELSGGKAAYIDEVLYIYNCSTMHNIFRKRPLEQMKMNYCTRARQPLAPLAYDPRKNLSNNHIRVGIMYYSFDANNSLQWIQSMRDILPLYDSYILYQTNNSTQKEYYHTIAAMYPEVRIINTEDIGTIKNILLQFCDIYSHILLCTSSFSLSGTIDILRMIQLLEKTHALGFYFCFGQNVTCNTALISDCQPPLIEVEDGIYAWKFANGPAQWHFPYTLHGALYKTADICSIVAQCVGTTYEELAKGLSLLHPPNLDDIGLCYMHTLSI